MPHNKKKTVSDSFARKVEKGRTDGWMKECARAHTQTFVTTGKESTIHKMTEMPYFPVNEDIVKSEQYHPVSIPKSTI
jgi:hypothetical protein